MTEPTDRGPARGAALLLAAGALTWLPARWGVMSTWDREWLSLGYASWNRLTLVPLLLLVAGSAAAARPHRRRAGAAGWAVTAAGVAVSAAGVALEFVVGGGLAEGPRTIAVWGWTTYLLGYALTAVGLLVLATAHARHDRPAAAASLVGAVSMLAWPLLLAAGQDALAVADQLLVPLAWLVLAARLPARDRVAVPAGWVR